MASTEAQPTPSGQDLAPDRRLCRSRLVRISELADRLGISRVTVWRWERSGRLPPKHQVGPNVVGWLETQLDAWFAKSGDATGWRDDQQKGTELPDTEERATP